MSQREEEKEVQRCEWKMTVVVQCACDNLMLCRHEWEMKNIKHTVQNNSHSHSTQVRLHTPSTLPLITCSVNVSQATKAFQFPHFALGLQCKKLAQGSRGQRTKGRGIKKGDKQEKNNLIVLNLHTHNKKKRRQRAKDKQGNLSGLK